MKIEYPMRALFLILLSLHIGVAVFVLQHRGDVRLPPIVNLVIAVILIIYWADRWYTYLADKVYINKASALVLLFAVVVMSISVLHLSGHEFAGTLHWVFYTVHSITLLLLLLFYRTFQRNRLF
ncbi:MAG: hypothetical protein OEZ39_11970 [Gammaproteobacteria bacterium]|nr:hypothetical protein [Gammaproteobacteria bacterium]MDH5652560.1 hypothetical protein [Gammaproteobacteria bacterium]